MAVCDSDQSFVAVLTHDVDRMREGQKAYVQLALLYTSPQGRRLVRVHNLCLSTTAAVSFRTVAVGMVGGMVDMIYIFII